MHIKHREMAVGLKEVNEDNRILKEENSRIKERLNVYERSSINQPRPYSIEHNN